MKNYHYNANHNIIGIDVRTGTYAENVYTSHILEYEIYKLYKYFRGLNIEDPVVQQCIKNKMKLKFKMRNAINTSANNNIEEVLFTGIGRASMLGVQMLILIKDFEINEYKVLMVKRSANVAARPDMWQFIPSGGFEIYAHSDENSLSILKEHFSVSYALLREYVEELFDLKEFEYKTNGEGIFQIKNDPHIIQLENILKERKGNLYFLGSTVDLTSLRNELSFVLVVNDREYSRSIFRHNFESSNIHRYLIKEVEEIFAQEKYKINPSSAALWYLFKNSNIYNIIVNKNEPWLQ